MVGGYTAAGRTRQGLRSGADDGFGPAPERAGAQEIEGQFWVLAEMEVDVAGQDAGSGVALVAGAVTRGVEELIGIRHLVGAVGDVAPVQFVTAQASAAPRENAILQGSHLSIPH